MFRLNYKLKHLVHFHYIAACKKITFIRNGDMENLFRIRLNSSLGSYVSTVIGIK